MDYIKFRTVTEQDFDGIVADAGGSRIREEGSADYVLNEAVIELKLADEEGLLVQTRQVKLAKLFRRQQPSSPVVIIDPTTLDVAASREYYNIIEGLHAKILLIDDAVVVMGSQNFTAHGRKNKEASAATEPLLLKTSFLETLQRWRDEAQPVDEQYINLLIPRLRQHARRHKQIVKEASESLRQATEEHEKLRESALLSKLEELESRSRIRLAQGVVYGSIQESEPWGGFYTLKAHHQYDLTRWIVKRTDRSTEPYDLERLSMYPVLVADTMRMGFARIPQRSGSVSLRCHFRQFLSREIRWLTQL